MKSLSEVQALFAYAKMLNRLDCSHIEDLLADDLRYTSQKVFEDLIGKAKYLAYIKRKLEIFGKLPQSKVYAEMAKLEWSSGHATDCLVLAQGDKENLVATLLCKTKDGKLSEIDMCIVPSPQSAIRSGEYPN